MSKWLTVLLFIVSLAAVPGYSQGSQSAPDPWKPLEFLLGTWEAKTMGGTAGAQGTGVYSFSLELDKHIMARHSAGANCKAPEDFNCEHSDLLYLYPEGHAIKAIYFDNEGHTIHYDVTTPTPDSAIFLSDGAAPGPQFRLIYEKKDTVLSGKFQMRMPGQTEFKSYLEWSGGKR